MGAAPFDEYRCVVEDEWIDENDHMNMGYYVVAFDHATDAFLDHAGLTPDFKNARRVATFTLESHVRYLRELRRGDPLRFTTQLVGFDEKRIHYFHFMYHAVEDYLASTNELMSLHVSMETRRGAPMAPEIRARLEEILDRHSALAPPPGLGRSIGLERGPA